jgi:hypothetical protein
MLLPVLPLFLLLQQYLYMSETESDSILENILTFTLPTKYAPGTDTMSKWILYNKEVTNIIVSKVISKLYYLCKLLDILLIKCVDPHAINEYTAKPTEWPNFSLVSFYLNFGSQQSH